MKKTIMKKYFTFKILLLFLVLCFSVEQSWALSLIDPYLNESGSTVASCSGQIKVGINGASTHWPSGIPPEGRVYENQLPVSQYTYGGEIRYTNGNPYNNPINNNNPMPSTSYFARSTIDTIQGFLSSEANHPESSEGVASGVTIYTRDLPSSASFSLSGGSSYLSQSARVGIEVYAATPDGMPLSTTWKNEWYGFMPDMAQGDILGSVVFSNSNGYLSWQVERWSWLPSTDPSWPFPMLDSTIIARDFGVMDFSQLNNYVQGIVNNRTSNYYYGGFANVYSFDTSGEGYIYAQLNYVPEPTTMLLLGLGLIGLAGVRRKFKN